MKQPEISVTLQKIADTFRSSGYQCYLVGGAVRSHLLGHSAKDFDLATDAIPEEIIRLFKRVIPTGIKHGTVTVIENKIHFEVTTFRTDGKYSDGRRPDSIKFIPNILEDLERRDFTINSIAYDIINQCYYDPNNGVNDLKKGVIRAIGEALERFSEDGLRPLRALRFVAQLGFSIDRESYEAIKKSLASTALISRERVIEEMFKLCAGSQAAHALFLMRDCGLMELLFPLLYRCRHHYYNNGDLLSYQIHSLDSISNKKVLPRIAALFAFIGLKGDFNPSLADKIAHDSGDLFFKIARDYRVSTVKSSTVAHLIRHQHSTYHHKWSDGDVRRFMAKVGMEYIDDWFSLVQGQLSAFPKSPDNKQNMDELYDRVKLLRTSSLVLNISQLAVTGLDLITLGVPQGHRIGLLLNILLNQVLESPNTNTRDQLIFFAEQMMNEV